MIAKLAIVGVVFLGGIAALATSIGRPLTAAGGSSGPNPSNPSTLYGTDPTSYNLAAWAADLSEIKDPAEWQRVAYALQIAGSDPLTAAASITALKAMASQLDAEGYHNAAKRCRIRAADIAAFYHLPG
jgi:hypothetical protein